jgi:hypothetical protein
MTDLIWRKLIPPFYSFLPSFSHISATKILFEFPDLVLPLSAQFLSILITHHYFSIFQLFRTVESCCYAACSFMNAENLRKFKMFQSFIFEVTVLLPYYLTTQSVIDITKFMISLNLWYLSITIHSLTLHFYFRVSAEF